MDEAEIQPNEKSGVARFFHVLWLLVDYSFNSFVDAIGAYIGIMRREASLFWGSAFVIFGLLSFQSDKFCDGNTADYLSCTRPTAYHFYGTFDKMLIVVGVFLVLIWLLRRAR